MQSVLQGQVHEGFVNIRDNYHQARTFGFKASFQKSRV